MAKVKSAITGEYIIQINEKSQVKVYRIFDNVIASLREAAAEVGFEIDPKWNTQETGRRLVANFGGGDQTATVGNYVITINANKSVNSYRTYSNTIGALREIAAKIGFVIDPKWNTQTTGSKLVDFINANK